MSLEEQITEIKNAFSSTHITSEREGGCLFLRLPSFFSDPENPDIKLDCLFACDPHLGYPTRLWFPKVIKTTEPRNWNSVDIYLLSGIWNAFSFNAKGNTLLEKLLSHYQGAK